MIVNQWHQAYLKQKEKKIGQTRALKVKVFWQKKKLK